MAVKLKIGLDFKTFVEVEKAVHDFCEVNFHTVWIGPTIKLVSEMQTKKLTVFLLSTLNNFNSNSNCYYN